ncbi:UDP-N-acetylmuramate:L-alanyl-gamma-D-glutamyl-meso-diaminopimelate ligase [Betaproteobacteria bacterium]|nr:UDP-N-acetylmuramate:L-alanyl-gamma-D-glutamyl-meso-diaminopimelate ligase [Betaproteobacteria bacterium]
MHIHIIGICGTFMAGLAVLAKELGFEVSGCDAKYYPPMSNQLEANKIECIHGFGLDNMKIHPDLWIIGNVATRGMPVIEKIISGKKNYMSGPEFLSQKILKDRPVIAVAGTHGKTTVSSIITWVLECAGIEPGFLIGGVPVNFGISARIGKPKSPFVIEADEYDTSFFDKRSKFLHYAADYVVLNNLEFDHADIFGDLDAIKRQFHHWIRTLGQNTVIYSNRESSALDDVLSFGVWSKVKRFNDKQQLCLYWPDRNGEASFQVFNGTRKLGFVDSPIAGEHNASNFLASYGIASELGINFNETVRYFNEFKGVKRRLELVTNISDIKIYDDFAHHPTAIKKTIETLRGTSKKKVGTTKSNRLIVVFEPRSNSLKLGHGKQQLAESFRSADIIHVYDGSVNWDVKSALKNLGQKLYVENNIQNILQRLLSQVCIGDTIVFMSNGDFQGILEAFVGMLDSKKFQR